ncbi:MAG: hypothetical protein JEZ08_01190 [Clostridiales bacterium]|nr:hypothetical protein [Clostridiales bacterium]
MVREKLIKKEVCHLFIISKEYLRHYENKLLLQLKTNDNNYMVMKTFKRQERSYY